MHIHWCMHKQALIARLSGLAFDSRAPGQVFSLDRIHRTHHEASSLEDRDVLRHGPVDGVLQVIVNIMVQRCTPWGLVKSRSARAIHNIVVSEL